MQSETPDTDLPVRMTATLKADIESVAKAYGQSANAWVVSVLENAVTLGQKAIAAKRATDEENRKLDDARQRLQDTLDLHSGRKR